ncbi:MAG: PepSY domain-containing protein [Gammaproteobacteria bacterium]
MKAVHTFLMLLLFSCLGALKPQALEIGLERTGAITLAQARIGQGQAIAFAREATGGRVLDVQTQNMGGRVIYLVKVLMPDGRVRIIAVDGETGQIR